MRRMDDAWRTLSGFKSYRSVQPSIFSGLRAWHRLVLRARPRRPLRPLLRRYGGRPQLSALVVLHRGEPSVQSQRRLPSLKTRRTSTGQFNCAMFLYVSVAMSQKLIEQLNGTDIPLNSTYASIGLGSVALLDL